MVSAAWRGLGAGAGLEPGAEAESGRADRTAAEMPSHPGRARAGPLTTNGLGSSSLVPGTVRISSQLGLNSFMMKRNFLRLGPPMGLTSARHVTGFHNTKLMEKLLGVRSRVGGPPQGECLGAISMGGNTQPLPQFSSSAVLLGHASVVMTSLAI